MIVLVTGASSGIGAACAARLEKAGHTVVGASRSGKGGRVLDIRDPTAITQLLADVEREFGRIDAVVNSAGVAVGGPVEDTPLELVQAQLETNLMGAVYLFRAAAPHLRRSAPSRMIHISSLAAHIALPYQALYSASHAGANAFCQALRYEMAPHGVRVIVVEPGSFRTGLTTNRRSPELSEPYAKTARTALDANDRDELKGVDPEQLAELVEKLLTARNPPDRCSAGLWEERIGLAARRFLPERIFRRIIGSHYGV